jgi:hypothetical protein
MAKRTAERKRVASGRSRKSAGKEDLSSIKEDVSSMVESCLPAGSRQRAVAKIAAAAGGALIAAAVLGVGPVALAGAAGYLVYRETHR